jgi:HK97 family phage portal protein
MSIWRTALQWLLGQARSIENPRTSLSDPGVWAVDAFGASTLTGVRVNRKVALTYSAVWRAVNLIATSVAKLPLHIYRRTGSGKERDTRHPSYSYLRRAPNSALKAYDFKCALQAHALLHGNGYAYIDRDAAGRCTGLYPLDSVSTYPVRENGRLWYVTDRAGTMARHYPDNILHIRGMSFDGLVGYPVIEAAAEAIGHGVGMRRHGAVFFRNGAKPLVVLEHPGKLSEQARANLRSGWERMHTGVENAHRTAILEEGLKAHALSISARDAQLIESRQFEVREIANFFGVPPHKLGDSARTAYNSLEQENQSFLDDCLDAWLVQWEEECATKLLSEEEKERDSHIVEFTREALVRANLDAQGRFYAVALDKGFMNRDEVRAKLNLNPIPDGHGAKYTISVQSQALESLDAAPEPSTKEPSDADPDSTD